MNPYTLSNYLQSILPKYNQYFSVELILPKTTELPKWITDESDHVLRNRLAITYLHHNTDKDKTYELLNTDTVILTLKMLELESGLVPY